MFIANVKKELAIRRWNYKILAEKTGYKVSTIQAFMCGARESSDVANCISKVLNLEI